MVAQTMASSLDKKLITMKKSILIVLLLALGLSALAQSTRGRNAGNKTQSVPIDNIENLFDESFQAKTVEILSEKEAQGKGVPSALVRTPDNKLAIMAKDKDGKLQPFYLKGIEVGFWDTRNANTDYDKVFDNYNKVGANTAMFIIHWSDIEPADGKFDFTFTDDIVQKARNHGIKIVWILFTHEQFDMPFLANPEDQWMYNLDTRDGVNYAIQWVKYDNGDISKDIPTQRAKKDSEIMPCFSNPKVYSRVVRMLERLAEHYANSDTVIGTQIGNEEHFSYQGSDSDYNPYTLDLFQKWTKLTGETSWYRFKMDMVSRWFSRWTTAYHQKAPYHITMINPIGGGPEKGEVDIVRKAGVDATTFRDSKIDAIATMFYGTSAAKQWKNLDQVYRINDHYSYPYQLPVLISTEIGIGTGNIPITTEYMVNFIERGSPGFAVFCYGSLVVGNMPFGPGRGRSREGELNEAGEFYKKFMDMVSGCEDIIWPGLPGTGNNISITSTCGEGKISCLHDGDNATLGILHFPDNMANESPTWMIDIPVEIMVKEPGTYSVEVYKGGRKIASHNDSITAKGRIIYVNTSNKESAFIKVKKL